MLITNCCFSPSLKEIDDILSGVLTSEDEEAVDKEFDELIAAEGAGDNMEHEDINLPDIPTDELPGKMKCYVLLSLLSNYLFKTLIKIKFS